MQVIRKLHPRGAFQMFWGEQALSQTVNVVPCSVSSLPAPGLGLFLCHQSLQEGSPPVEVPPLPRIGFLVFCSPRPVVL